MLDKRELCKGQQASLGVPTPLAGALCICFVRLDFLSENKNTFNVGSILYFSAFPVLKSMNRGGFTRASICKIAHYLLPRV